jgi:hypothetical protein
MAQGPSARTASRASVGAQPSETLPNNIYYNPVHIYVYPCLYIRVRHFYPLFVDVSVGYSHAESYRGSLYAMVGFLETGKPFCMSKKPVGCSRAVVELLATKYNNQRVIGLLHVYT